MWNDEDNNPYGAFERHDDEAIVESFHPASMSPRKYALVVVGGVVGGAGYWLRMSNIVPL